MPALPAEPWPEHQATVAGCSRIAGIGHTITSTTQLLRVLPLIACDRRVQVHFTNAPDDFGGGTEELLRERGASLVPWGTAIKAPYRLALAASLGELHRVRAPVVTLPHGAGRHKLVARKPGGGPAAFGETYGIDRGRITYNGSFVATKTVLSHVDQLALLDASCPGAAEAIGAVVGDPIHDQIVAALPARAHYRRGLGIDDGQRLVVVSSTWGSRSLYSRCETLLPRLLTALPRAEYQVIAIFHPNLWVEHSPYQVRQWLTRCRDLGLRVVEPQDDWPAAVIAADWVIGDHGSVTLYASLTQASVLLATFPEEVVVPGSPPLELAEAAPRLRFDRHGPPIEAQLHAAAGAPREPVAAVGRRITSEPGRFAENMRRLLYELIELPEPAWPATLPPVQIPRWRGPVVSATDLSGHPLG
jgi:hypothetical protein